MLRAARPSPAPPAPSTPGAQPPADGPSTCAKARRRPSPTARSPGGLPAVALAAEHELAGQRDARRRRGVGDDRDGLGHAAGHRAARAVLALADDLVLAALGQRALQAGVQARGLEVVQQVLGLVLEADDRDL